MITGLVLRVLPGEYAIARLPEGAPVPVHLFDGPGLVSITKAPGEVSLVCPPAEVPAGAEVTAGWTVLRVDGPLDFDLVGILAGLTRALADRGVSVFALSTYDTDLLLVRRGDLRAAVDALQAAGVEVVTSPTRP